MVKPNKKEDPTEEITRCVNELLSYHAKYFRKNDIGVHDGLSLVVVTYNNMIIQVIKEMTAEKQVDLLSYQLNILGDVTMQLIKAMAKAKK